MTTAIEITLDAELEPLEEVAAKNGWPFKRLTADTFALSLPARDQSWFHLQVLCDRYPAIPPAWHWADQDGNRIGQKSDTPIGGNFLHSSGVICAPWNRLAYKSEDSRGPHSDWTIGAWRQNSYTKACTEITAMALRIFVELTGPNFNGRQEKRP